MWRNLAKHAYTRRLQLSSQHSSFSPSNCTSRFYFPDKARALESQDHVNSLRPVAGLRRIGVLSFQQDELGRPGFGVTKTPVNFFGLFGYQKGYASAAEAIASEEDMSGVDEVQELVEEVNKGDKLEKQPKLIGGVAQGKHNVLRRRQIKMETEAWEEAAKEYRELLSDMCEQKLAPNLPYIKSLFLGWFEPLRDVIAAEQDLCKQGKNRAAYAPYFDHLPADMMAVITMHKLMGLLMTGEGNGSARVVQAACHIGEAIEHEVGKLRGVLFFFSPLYIFCIWVTFDLAKSKRITMCFHLELKLGLMGKFILAERIIIKFVLAKEKECGNSSKQSMEL